MGLVRGMDDMEAVVCGMNLEMNTSEFQFVALTNVACLGKI